LAGRFSFVESCYACSKLLCELRLGRLDVRKGFAFPVARSKGKAMPDECGVAANLRGIATESQRLSAHREAQPQ